MADTNLRYMGLALANPVIAGASDLTADEEGARRIEEAGAGALVVRSLFEEQVQWERWRLEETRSRGEAVSGEMSDIFPRTAFDGAKEHLKNLRRIKAAVKIPVIASLNAVERATWIEYARSLAGEGADALELNFYASPRDPELSGARVEEEQLDIVREIRSSVKIPIAAKLSPFYSNPLNFISRMDREGVEGLVLFNRFVQPDIDVESQSVVMPFNLSTHADSRLPQRFCGLLHGRMKADLCAATGILSGKDVAKMILAGAVAVQVVSALYRHGSGVIRTMLSDFSRWMDGKSYRSLSDFRGRLGAGTLKDGWVYTRAQYVRMLLEPKEFGDPSSEEPWK